MGKQTDKHQCVTDGPNYYGNNERATIKVLRDGAINSKGRFETESASHDYLRINGRSYGGNGIGKAPMNVQVSRGQTFTWISDYSRTRHGWTVCLEEYVAPTNSPTLSPTGTCTVSFSSFIVLPAIANLCLLFLSSFFFL